MSNTQTRSGHCLCGAVKIEAKSASNSVGACHCSSCRRWGGGALMAIDCGDEVSFDGSEHVSVFSSSEWAERGFCNRCGTHLFYRIKQTGLHIMPVGLFAADDSFTFDHQVFIDEKPSMYRFANETEDMTGAEVFAKYGSQT